MDCEPQGVPFRERMRRRAVEQDVPLNGMLELTRRCSFQCTHCYAGPARSSAGELSTDEWKRLIDEAAAAGCLNLVLTGGEPLLRGDFETLYVHARRKGMEVLVFTNAALAGERTAALFHEWPPFGVEVSVYGVTEETARRVTGVAGACEAQWRGIRLLRERGVPVSLKITALRALQPEIAAIAGRARDMGLKLRFGAELTPRLDGDPAPLEQALDPAEAAALEEVYEPGWAESLKARLEGRSGGERRYPCAAGQYGFFIDTEGFLQPCLAIRSFRRNVRAGGLAEAWRAVRDAARGEKRSVDEKGPEDVLYKCFVCVGFNEWGGNAAVLRWRKDLARARIARVL